ncbi:unnamed protein product, partial [Linum tenue]
GLVGSFLLLSFEGVNSSSSTGKRKERRLAALKFEQHRPSR